MHNRHQRREQHSDLDRLRAKMLGAEEKPCRGVGGRAQQRDLDVRVEARDAKLHNRGGISGSFDGRSRQRAVRTDDRSPPMSRQPGDRLGDPMKISCPV